MKETFDISIPLDFNRKQPNVYGVEPAESKACEYGDLVGDTRRGGSVNFEHYTLIPHCHGTHTECVGHITDERISVTDCLEDVLIDAVLISVEPESALNSGERYTVELDENDQFLTRYALQAALGESNTFENQALIVRTLPNDDSKLTRAHASAPFFSNDAMELIVGLGFKHLLVDLPSIDRLRDDGKLSNHRIFWKVPLGSKTLTEESRVSSTVTELIYVPEIVSDGQYLLNIQIPPFLSDAAPSRPILISGV